MPRRTGKRIVHKQVTENTISPKKNRTEYKRKKSLKEGIEDVYTQVPAKTIAIEEGKDIGSWNQGGLKGDKNVLITTFVGPKDIEDF